MPERVLLKEGWDAVRKCSWFKQVLVSSLDTHGKLGEFLAFFSTSQTQRYPATKLHLQKALQVYRLSALLLMISSCLSTPGQCLALDGEKK